MFKREGRDGRVLKETLCVLFALCAKNRPCLQIFSSSLLPLQWAKIKMALRHTYLTQGMTVTKGKSVARLVAIGFGDQDSYLVKEKERDLFMHLSLNRHDATVHLVIF
jgi:hypothetical protein